MNAETSLGNGPSHRHRSLPVVRVDPGFESEGPVPSGPRASSAGGGWHRQRNSEAVSPALGNLAASFPLFFFGAGCVAAATFVLLAGSGAAIGRVPLWLPFAALGIIALVGGTLSVFAEPDAGPDTSSERAPTQSAPAPPVSPLIESTAVPRPRPAQPPRADPQLDRRELARPRPQRNAARSRGMGSSAPPLERLDDPVPSRIPTDAGALLEELDRIEADLHSAGAPGEAAPSAPRPQAAAVATNGRPSTLSSMVKSRPEASPRSSPVVLEELESEAPSRIATCGGCGSVIIDGATISQCHVCGEQLCSECKDRSRLEGTPNVCPLCSLLGTVHSSGPAAVRPTAQRT